MVVVVRCAGRRESGVVVVVGTDKDGFVVLLLLLAETVGVGVVESPLIVAA